MNTNSLTGNDIFHYTTAAAAARAEKREDIALSFEQIAAAGKRHLTSYEQLLERLNHILFADRIRSAVS
ncbi:MAG: hypothetical protein AB1817_00030 [Chloroflexota bacterium]